MKKKKGFTLVELLVVIAILAILATVSVVGYMGFTKKAHESNDIGLTTQMNTILQAEEVTNKPTTPHDAVNQLANGGVDVEKLTPTTDGYNYVYDLETNRMFLLDNDKHVVAPTNIEYTEDLNVFAFVGSEEEINNWKGYSVYLKTGFVGTELDITTGLDVGDNNLTTINYTGSDTAKEVLIRTNGGTLNINAENDNLAHYGLVSSVDVKAIAPSSYHEYGKAGFISIEKGRVVVEKDAKVITVYATANTAIVDNNSGTLENAYVADGVTATGNTEFKSIPNDRAIEDIKIEAENKINAVAKIGDNYYSGLDAALTAALSKNNETIEIINDVDLHNELWKPVEILKGKTLTINGNNFTIRNLFVNGFVKASDGSMDYANGSAATYKCGLFASNQGTLNINSLNIDNALSDMDTSKDTNKTGGSSQISIIVGYNSGTLSLNNVNISNSVAKGYTKVGLFVGHAAAGNIEINHCSLENNNVTLEADGNDPEACLSGVIIGYNDPKGATIVTNGIKLVKNTIEIDNSVSWKVQLTTKKGTIGIASGAYKEYYLTSQTFVRGNFSSGTIAEFEVGADGYSYEK